MFWSHAMTQNQRRCFLFIALFFWCNLVSAALSCTAPVSSGFSTAYAATGVVPNVKQGMVSFNCTRTSPTDATSILLTANDGTHSLGAQNHAQSGSRILYEAYRDSSCSVLWTSKLVSDYWPITLLNVLGSQAINVNYWGCITLANQVVNAGNYTDTVTMQVLDTTPLHNALSVSRTFPVSITTPASLSITAPPGSLVFTYTAFGSSVNASSTFKTNGTLNLPYTMSLDANSGVVAGLQYDLKINGQVPPVSAVGSGAVQTHTILGTILAGQAGTCSTGTCASTQVRILTITY
jgi:hypothetical protein